MTLCGAKSSETTFSDAPDSFVIVILCCSSAMAVMSLCSSPSPLQTETKLHRIGLPVTCRLDSTRGPDVVLHLLLRLLLLLLVSLLSSFPNSRAPGCRSQAVEFHSPDVSSRSQTCAEGFPPPNTSSSRRNPHQSRNASQGMTQHLTPSLYLS